MTDSTREFEDAIAERKEPFDQFIASIIEDPKEFWQSMIDDKLESIRFWSEDITLMLKLKSKIKDRAMQFEIDHYIGVVHQFIRSLHESLADNRRWMRGEP